MDKKSKRTQSTYIEMRQPTLLIILLFSFFILGMKHPPLKKKIDLVYFGANSIEELEESESLILSSLKIFPDKTDLIWRLARNYFRIGKRTVDKDKKLNFFEKCLSTAKKGMRINNNSAENIYFMGLCLGNVSLQNGIFSSLNNRDTLETLMQRVIKINPAVEYAGPHRFLGVYYHVLPFFLGGDSEKSIYHLESAVSLAPDFYENYFYLGKVYFDQGHYSKGRAALKRYLQLSKTIKNDFELPEQIDEAREILDRMKINKE
jgi:tetratricopeptide (TPR) repeat protein